MNSTNARTFGASRRRKSRIAIDTEAAHVLSAALPLTLVATSTLARIAPTAVAADTWYTIEQGDPRMITVELGRRRSAAS